MGKAKVFMIMPLKGTSLEAYEMLKRELDADYDIIHAGDVGNQQNILEDIFVPLFESDAIIADLSGLNPNVLYELGVAHSFNKKVIIITQDPIDSLPFDLKQYRAKDYDTSYTKFSNLLSHIKTNLDGAIDGSVRFSNPINDFLTKNKAISIANQLNENEAHENPDITEKGYLDYMSGIEEDMQAVTQDLSHIVDEMNDLTSKMQTNTELLQQSKSSGSATISFIRFQAKTVAGYIDKFSGELRTINKTIDLAPESRTSYNVRKREKRLTKELKEDGKKELHSRANHRQVTGGRIAL